MALITIWGDESCQNGHKYMVLGTIWENPVCTAELERDIQNVKRKTKFDKEFHWTEMKGHQLSAYAGLVEVFREYMQQGLLKFRALVVDQADPKHKKYSEEDELHFYKMFFWLIYKKLLEENTYDIFLDRKNNSVAGRLSDLKNSLNNKMAQQKGILRSNLVRRVEPRDGSQVQLQLADVFAGAIAYVKNGRFDVNAEKYNPKHKLIVHIQKQLQLSLNECHRPKESSGFNIWCFERT